MAFSSKQEDDYKSQLEQIAAEVDSYIVKTDGALKRFREQIKPLAQRWKAYYEAVDKRKKELLDHWELVKKNPKLQDKNLKPHNKNWEWDSFYMHGLGGLSDSNPINEMPAKYASDVMAVLEKYLERNEKNEQGYPENSNEYKRHQEAIAEQRQNLEYIRSEFDKLSSAEKKSVWIKTPQTLISNKTYEQFEWWRLLNLPDETVFGCWRPPLIPLPEYPLNILKPVESEYHINQTRKELPDARNTQEEYERYYIFLSSVHDNYLQGVEKITEGIWLDILPTAVLSCLDKGHGDKTAFLKAALERVCQSKHKTDKKKKQESLQEIIEALKNWQESEKTQKDLEEAKQALSPLSETHEILCKGKDFSRKTKKALQWLDMVADGKEGFCPALLNKLASPEVIADLERRQEKPTVSSETRTDKWIKKIKDHPVISIIIILGIIIIAFGTVAASLDNILNFWNKIAHSPTTSTNIFAYVSKDGTILRSKNFPWKISKSKDNENDVTYIIVGRYGDSSAASVIPDNSINDYIIYNSMSGVAVKFTCPEEKISNFAIKLKY